MAKSRDDRDMVGVVESVPTTPPVGTDVPETHQWLSVEFVLFP